MVWCGVVLVSCRVVSCRVVSCPVVSRRRYAVVCQLYPAMAGLDAQKNFAYNTIYLWELSVGSLQPGHRFLHEHLDDTLFFFGRQFQVSQLISIVITPLSRESESHHRQLLFFPQPLN